ncbi:MAG: HNH endonuclease, partial [Armatimonadetes bacterium]|nr:HNH endonuclease [Armatimonadota bacterium]
MSSAVLVLNVSYEFLNVASLERAVKLIYKGKAEIVEAIPGRQIGSSTFKIQMPSIIRLLYYICRP